ncbi:hypothetical protein [Microbacterium sp. CH12i]|uniref:hypothetical protein n=1 Tax=Microbacterium sp. CH12i TaxID=1479651 RepID=UPI001267EB0E|nr:hypothetical protein [Microbacterium sp. CH12i]
MTDPDAPDVNDPAQNSAQARTTATGYRSVSYFLPASLHARLKAAWWATRDLVDGAPTLSALVERIFVTEVSRLEQEHNAGAPFPEAPRGAQGHRGSSSEDHRYVAYYLPALLHTRLKAAWWATRSATSPTLSALVERVFVEEASRLEGSHNAGEVFSPAPDSARGVSVAAARRQGEWLRREWETRRGEATTDS